MKFQLKLSNREIARSQCCSSSTVSLYVNKALSGGLKQWDDVASLTESDIQERLGEKKSSLLSGSPIEGSMPNWKEIHDELQRKDHQMTLMLLWEEYKQTNPEGLGRTQFFEHYRRWKLKLSVWMRHEHKAGEKVFVDYCDGITLKDPVTGAEQTTELFVGCLGASSYTYAEATYSQAEADWLMSHVRMYEYFQGVPEIHVPDNLASGVTKPCRYDPQINRSYQELIHYYGSCVIPAHVRKPRHKAKVESAVLITQRWILASLRNRVFSSLAELNQEIRILLDKLNTRIMKQYGESRRDLFIKWDQPALKPLPSRPYEYAQWIKDRLEFNYHVKFDDHYYSAPYQLARQVVWIRVTDKTLEIFHRGARISSHVRSFLKGKQTTTPEHMPPNHRYRQTPEQLQVQVVALGLNTQKIAEKIFENKSHPEAASRAVSGLLHLAKIHGKERLEKASTRALEIQSPTYSTLKNILKNRMESLCEKSQNQFEPKADDLGQSNVRGSDYYH